MLVRRLARPMLASWYVHDGLDAVRAPAPHVAVTRPVADRVTSALGRDPLPDRTLAWAVRAHGAATILAGVGLALGRAPRSSAAALAALTLPLVVAQQPFTSPRKIDRERVGPFVHALGGTGAAILAAVDLEGRPGVAWRVDKARRDRADRATQED
ncbi:DoxX family membrane protein [Sanguibacter sp. HDW7]|uniref:DoxX family membrane protein n=1 Tax=Sanguibacter sp. HDW7 TaxID=2714931 RepID=UPI00140CE3C4|nr:DoxX family membrane protein [Sanguibacter sp. HDW7]QIK82904.1 DoxX family membrane protein [Sanguibacter sp. HDW7]